MGFLNHTVGSHLDEVVLRAGVDQAIQGAVAMVKDLMPQLPHNDPRRIAVIGGSWGSTLALAYAITHPERVTELVLRGIFLLRKKELDFFYEGQGTNFLFPEQWEAYEAAIPKEEHAGGFIKAYGRRLRGELGEEEMFAASKAWSVWEGSVSRLRSPGCCATRPTTRLPRASRTAG